MNDYSELQAMISNDVTVLTPPTIGTYDWDTFMPGAAGFPAVGATYTDPIFGAVNPEGSVIRALTNVGSRALFSDTYAFNRSNADGTYWMDDGTTSFNLTIRSTTIA